MLTVKSDEVYCYLRVFDNGEANIVFASSRQHLDLHEEGPFPSVEKAQEAAILKCVSFPAVKVKPQKAAFLWLKDLYAQHLQEKAA